MQVTPISNQNFKANVHMDLYIQDAYKKCGKLRDTVEILKKVKCDEIYLIHGLLKGRADYYDTLIKGQSIHADGSLQECFMGYYRHDDRDNIYVFEPAHETWTSDSRRDPENYYNLLLYYSKADV